MSESAPIIDRAFWCDPTQVLSGLTFLVVGILLGVVATLVLIQP